MTNTNPTTSAMFSNAIAQASVPSLDAVPPPLPPRHRDDPRLWQCRELRPGVTRVRDSSGFAGTVLYVGPVASAKDATEVYAGVSWDDPTRGKHDGSVVCRRTGRFVRHFLAVGGATGGSFLRMSKFEAASASTPASEAAVGSDAKSSSPPRPLPMTSGGWDAGVPLTIPLMRTRYLEPGAPPVAPNDLFPGMYANTSGSLRGRDGGGRGGGGERRGKAIEFLGEIKLRTQQQIEDNEEVGLRMLGICGPLRRGGGEVDEEAAASMTKQFGHLKGMDLAGNLLSTWDDALSVLRQFPFLERVSLAANRLRDLSSDPFPSPPGGEFRSVVSLNLNGCGLTTFGTVMAAGAAMPHLKELCAAHNDLSDMGGAAGSGAAEGGDAAPERIFSNLALLDLSHCRLDSWSGRVRRTLCRLPKLECLSLDDNPIVCIEAASTQGGDGEDDNGGGVEFPSLTSLQLASTSLASWSSVDALSSAFPSLRSLRLRDVPLASGMGAGEVRSSAVARIPGLEWLNASAVADRERTEAERRYVSGVARELLLADTSAPPPSANGAAGDVATTESEARRAEILAGHPRFEDLLAKHRDAMTSASSSGGCGGGGGSIGSDVVNVSIRSMAPSSCDCEPLRKRLPRSLKVGRIKAMCSRAFGLENEVQILHFRVEGDPFPSELDDDENTLAHYGVPDGAEILVNEDVVIVEGGGAEARRRREKDEETRRWDERARIEEERYERKMIAAGAGGGSAAVMGAGKANTTT